MGWAHSAGPAYGLFRLGDWATDIGPVSNTYLCTPFAHNATWNMTPLDEGSSQDAYVEAIVQRESVYYQSEHTTGSLRICHYGCAIYYLLVATGVQTGRIWVDDRASDQGIYPALDAKTGRPLSFSDWYGDWLKTSLSSLDVPRP